MKRIEYNKLIRDRIPEIIESTGKAFEVTVMSTQEFQDALKVKLLEEASEAKEASSRKDLIKELSDIYEVIDALCVALRIDKSDVLELQKRRKEKRGGFTEQLKLLWVDDPD
jgi:predicted house-cleaning noncanonical NTP pyrophosphatase (MazG superfamily)